MRSEHPIQRKLRENRERARLIIATQAQLARRLDMDAAVLSRYLSTGRVPERVVASAAELLGCDVAELMSSEPVAA